VAIGKHIYKSSSEMEVKQNYSGERGKRAHVKSNHV
jgi:hypothetical protein